MPRESRDFLFPVDQPLLNPFPLRAERGVNLPGRRQFVLQRPFLVRQRGHSCLRCRQLGLQFDARSLGGFRLAPGVCGLFLRLLLSRDDLCVGLLLHAFVQSLDCRHQIRGQTRLSGLGPVVMPRFPLFQQGSDGAVAAGTQHLPDRIDRDRLFLLRQLSQYPNR